MVVKSQYVPEKGDVIWLNFSPQSGKEQAGRRSAVVVSSRVYNIHGLLLACPITSQAKGYPFEVPLDLRSGNVDGVVLADHIKSQDWKARRAEFAGKIHISCLEQIQSLIAALLLQ